MNKISLVLIALAVSAQSFGAGCMDSYAKVAKKGKTTKQKLGDAAVLGAVSSTVAIVSFGTGGPGLMLTGLGSFALGGYLGGDEDENSKREAWGAYNLIKEAKVGSGYHLRDATVMIRKHFDDQSISEADVAEKVLKYDSEMLYCKDEKLMGLSGILMKVGKSIIEEKAISESKQVNDKSRHNNEKISMPKESSSKEEASKVLGK